MTEPHAGPPPLGGSAGPALGPAGSVAVGWPLGPTVALRAALPLFALALGLLAPGRSAAQGPPLPAPALVSVAEAYTAAWNAHDLPAVLALFAPDAVVRERRGAVPPAVWDTRDPQVVRAYLEGSHDGDTSNPSNLVWVAGPPAIATWAAARFAQNHRYVAGPSRAAGDTVDWSYLEFADPHQLLPGAGPAAGDAEAVVRGGRITRLTLVQSPASVQRQRDEVRAAGAWAVATRRAAPLGAEPRLPLSGPPRAAAAEPPAAAWPLALGGLALLAAVTVGLRRRRRP